LGNWSIEKTCSRTWRVDESMCHRGAPAPSCRESKSSRAVDDIGELRMLPGPPRRFCARVLVRRARVVRAVTSFVFPSDFPADARLEFVIFGLDVAFDEV
jgi:hypothetical protein